MMYLYCITDAGLYDLNNLDMKELCFIDCKAFTIVAAETKNFEPTAPQSIMDHYEINNTILKNGFTVLPFSYGTMIPLQDVHTFAMDKRERILLNLEQFKGKVEMGVKILVLSNNDQNNGLSRPLGDTPGHRYFSHRMGKYAPLISGYNTVQKLLADIDRCVCSIHRGYKMKTYNKNTLLMSLAFLIDEKSKNEFIASIQRLKSLYPDCRFLLSGAWPAYNFIHL